MTLEQPKELAQVKKNTQLLPFKCCHYVMFNLFICPLAKQIFLLRVCSLKTLFLT